MRVQREEFYFEQRCIDEHLGIRWYGERYFHPEFEKHFEETVYIRDNGRELFIYSLDSDNWNAERKIKAIFTLICRIRKNSTGRRYGRKIR